MRDVERRCIAEVARARGGTAEEPDDDQWPDGWLVNGDGVRLAAEVVTAFPCSDGEKWARNYQKGAKEASKRHPAVGFHVDRSGNATVLDDDASIPPAVEPIDNVTSIVAAIENKASKYGPNEVSRAILIVHQVQQISPLRPCELSKIAERASRGGSVFAEVWVLNEFGDQPQRVPTG